MVLAHRADFRRTRLGDLDIFSLSDGAIESSLRPGIVTNATVEDVSAALKEADLPGMTVRTPFTAMAIAKGDHLMLVDTGTGGFTSLRAALRLLDGKSSGSWSRPRLSEDDPSHSPAWGPHLWTVPRRNARAAFSERGDRSAGR